MVDALVTEVGELDVVPKAHRGRRRVQVGAAVAALRARHDRLCRHQAHAGVRALRAAVLARDDDARGLPIHLGQVLGDDLGLRVVRALDAKRVRALSGKHARLHAALVCRRFAGVVRADEPRDVVVEFVKVLLRLDAVDARLQLVERALQRHPLAPVRAPVWHHGQPIFERAPSELQFGQLRLLREDLGARSFDELVDGRVDRVVCTLLRRGGRSGKLPLHTRRECPSLRPRGS